MTTQNQDIMIPEITPELKRGPQWLQDKRTASKESYNNSPIPRRGLHLWRYTDPASFVVDKDQVVDTAFRANLNYTIEAELAHLKDGNLSAFVVDKSGRDIEINSSDNVTSDVIIISTLSDAVESHFEIVNKHLYSLVNNETGKFEAMNSALWNDGIFIYIPDGKTVEQPIHLLRESGLDKSAQFPRLLVVVGKNSEVTIIDEYAGGSETQSDNMSLTNSAVEIFGDIDSRTRYISLQRNSEGAKIYLAHRANAEQNASILTVPLAFGGAISKQNFGVTLNGEGADSKMYGLLFGGGRQHYDNHTLHHHAVGKTTSDINFKVVLKDKANSAYTGLIRIENSAKVCEAYQENRNLLLNKGCKAETIPELEILNEDVICSHGATIGPLDPEMVFFLKCRGINETDATRMIVSGFVEATLKQVPADLKEKIPEFVAKRLEDI